MRTVFLVPRRADKHRDQLWEWCKARWHALFPDIPIYEGHHEASEGLFSRAAAINRAARQADADGRWDLAIVIDADVFLKRSQVQAAIDTATRTRHVTWAHRRWRGLNEDSTMRIIAERRDFGSEIDNVDMDILVERTTPLSWSCCFVVPRAVFDDAGGFDERFRGWGFEDLAWQSLVCGLYGYERLEGDVIHLYHPRSEERIIKGEPASTASAQYIANGRLGRRYMYALRRDYGRTDRPDASDAAELARDLANLKRDDAKFALLQTPAERAQWEDWWPTLEELRDGAKEAGRSVTVIVHTGGEPETWKERSGYLRKSLASLVKQVSGPITQRVIYSDWGDQRLDDLRAIGEPFGFYVAGPSEHLGYTGSMKAMWRYLAKRAKGVYVFQAEDDFLFLKPVDLRAMILALEENPQLAQLALLRQAAYPREFENGGILGWPETEFTSAGSNGRTHLEHRLFWTQNPSLYRRTVTATPWPSGRSSERLFGDALAKDPAVRFGLWGSGEPWLKHIGAVRAGTEY
jgi:hypothetical protein